MFICECRRHCLPSIFATSLGSGQTVLHCTHRTSDFLTLCPHPARRLVWSPLRASSDHSFIVGALRAQRPCQLPRPSPSKLASPLWKGTHVGLSAPVERGPSQGARSGSTGPTWVSFQSFSPCAFCEQEGRPGGPYLTLLALAPSSDCASSLRPLDFSGTGLCRGTRQDVLGSPNFIPRMGGADV